MKTIMLLFGTFLGIFFLSNCQTEGKKQETQPNMRKISLAEWSLHRELWAGKISNLDFPRITKQEFGIDRVEYVSQFFQDKAEDETYLQQLKDTCAKYGVQSHLIMVDGEGELGETDPEKRKQAVENHKKWVKAAKFLGCHAIRVNANGIGDANEVAKATIESLKSLSAFAQPFGINILVENHGMMVDGQWKNDAPSTNGAWLASVLKQVNQPNCGALPDFGNFADYDRYQGVKDLLPFAKGISAKTLDFDENGEDTRTDFSKMFALMRAANFDGYIGIEYEGDEKNGLSERDGIRKTLALIRKY